MKSVKITKISVCRNFCYCICALGHFKLDHSERIKIICTIFKWKFYVLDCQIESEVVFTILKSVYIAVVTHNFGGLRFQGGKAPPQTKKSLRINTGNTNSPS